MIVCFVKGLHLFSIFQREQGSNWKLVFRHWMITWQLQSNILRRDIAVYLILYPLLYGT